MSTDIMDTNTTKDPNPQTLLQNVWSTWRYFLTVRVTCLFCATNCPFLSLRKVENCDVFEKKPT